MKSAAYFQRVQQQQVILIQGINNNIISNGKIIITV